MRNVALDGKRSFLICIPSTGHRFTESANKCLPLIRGVSTQAQWRLLGRPQSD